MASLGRSACQARDKLASCSPLTRQQCQGCLPVRAWFLVPCGLSLRCFRSALHGLAPAVRPAGWPPRAEAAAAMPWPPVGTACRGKPGSCPASAAAPHAQCNKNNKRSASAKTKGRPRERRSTLKTPVEPQAVVTLSVIVVLGWEQGNAAPRPLMPPGGLQEGGLGPGKAPSEVRLWAFERATRRSFSVPLPKSSRGRAAGSRIPFPPAEFFKTAPRSSLHFELSGYKEGWEKLNHDLRPVF